MARLYRDSVHSYDLDDAYQEVLEDIGKPDMHGMDDAWKMGLRGILRASTLHWVGGKTLRVDGLDAEEISLLADCDYDTARLLFME